MPRRRPAFRVDGVEWYAVAATRARHRRDASCAGHDALEALNDSNDVDKEEAARAKAKRLNYCNRYNTKGYPCRDGKCSYSPCSEWEELLKTDVLKGSVYEDPLFMPKGQGKGLVPSVEDKENPYNNYP